MALHVKQIVLKSVIVIGLLVGLSGCISIHFAEERDLFGGFRRWTAVDTLRVLYGLDKHSLAPASTFHTLELDTVKRRATLIGLSAAFKHVGLAEAQARGASAIYEDALPEPKRIKLGIIDDFGGEGSHGDWLPLVREDKILHDFSGEGSHGELVASFALAAAPDAEVLVCAVKAYEKKLDTDNIIQCLKAALAEELDVLNLSFGHDSLANFLCTAVPPELDDESRRLLKESLMIEDLRRKGTIIVGAAGNDGKHRETHFPGCRGDISAGAVYGDFYQAVSSCNEFNVQPDDVTCFSNYGNLFAPGYFVLMGEGPLAGTSFASPLIAGAAALIKGTLKKRAPQSPHLSHPGGVVNSLFSYAVEIEDRFRTGLPHRRLNALAPIANYLEPTPKPRPLLPVVDRNQDCYINDEEVLFALNLWTTGTPLGGLLLTDTYILDVLNAWIKGQNICH